jgi:hypothetical protein
VTHNADQGDHSARTSANASWRIVSIARADAYGVAT